MLSITIKNKETKNQAGTKQTPGKTESPISVSPSDVAPAVATLPMQSRSTDRDCIGQPRAELAVGFLSSTGHTASHSNREHCTPAYPLSAVLETPNCSQSLSRGFLIYSPRHHQDLHGTYYEDNYKSLHSRSLKQRGSNGKNMVERHFLGNKNNKGSKNLSF